MKLESIVVKTQGGDPSTKSDHGSDSMFTS